MLAKLFPHPDGLESFWRTEVGTLDRHRTTIELPEYSDIVVIGAGYSSAALVTHLLGDGSEESTASILVLEARQLSSGATGRNGGHLKPDNYFAIARLAREYGIEAAAELATFEVANVKAVKEFVTKEKVDCDFVETRAIDVQLTEETHRLAKQAHNLVSDAGVEASKETFVFPEKYAEQASGVKGAMSAYSYAAGHIWPYKLVHHMFSKAIRRGVNLQTETTVTQIPNKPDSEGVWSLQTNRGVIRTKKVIVATNAYTPALLPEYKERIIPYKAICCRIECPKGRAPLLANTYALRFADWDFDYLIPRPDGSIIVGGARSRYLHDKAAWYGNTDDSTLVGQAKDYFDGYMQRHFKGWEHSGAHVSHIWTGIMGYSCDGLPRVGAVPDRPGIFIMAGFTGHGMPQIFLTAAGLARIVRNGIHFQESGIPRLFRETSARLEAKTNIAMDLWRKAQTQSKL